MHMVEVQMQVLSFRFPINREAGFDMDAQRWLSDAQIHNFFAQSRKSCFVYWILVLGGGNLEKLGENPGKPLKNSKNI